MEGIQYGIQQGYNPMTAAAYAAQPYASQPYHSQQQSLFGGPATPLGGLLGSGIAGLMSGQSAGRQPGQVIDGYNPGLQAFGNVDPITAHIQQSQLAHQAQLAQQAQLVQQQAQLAQLVQAQLAQAQLAQQLAQQQIPGRWSPFGQDPFSAAIAQGRAQFNPLNRIDPITAAYIQQAQVAQLCQQLALQNQLGQQGQYGLNQPGFGQQTFGQPTFGQPNFNQQGFNPHGQNWLNGGLNPWANPQFATQFGRGGQLPIY